MPESLEDSNLLSFSWSFGSFFDFLALFLGKRGLPYENIDRDLHFSPVVGPIWPLQKILKNRDLEISEITNIDEIDRIYMASPWGLSVGKTEPPDYILMCSSANVPGITYKINFGRLLSSIFGKKYLRVPPRFLWFGHFGDFSDFHFLIDCLSEGSLTRYSVPGCDGGGAR